MSVLLIVVGAIVAVLGLGTVGYGIPIKEFSFGNTLIIAGTTAFIGGFIIVAIGVAIRQLQRLAEMLAHAPLQVAGAADTFEAPATAHAAPPPPIPFPTRPKPERDIAEPAPFAPPPPPPAAEGRPAAAPMLRNPDTPVSLAERFEVPEHEDVSLAPPPQAAAMSEPEPLPPPPPAETFFAPPPLERHPEPPPASADESWRPMSPPPPPPPPPPRTERQGQTSYFDTMWPADNWPPRRPPVDEPEVKPEIPPAPAPEAPREPVAILKSGVVDGMAYTLYIDGSIEAELPNGTLHFASINELRDHLAKSS